MILSTTHKDALSAFHAAALVASENDEDATVTTTSSSFKDKYGVIPPPPLPTSSISSSSANHSHSGSGHHHQGHSTGHGHGHGHSKRPLVLFSWDISHWPSWIQFIVLVGGLIVFMCLYGYYQELVIYGWFNRQLSLFSTFLHFLGCSVFAQLQRHVTTPPLPPPPLPPHPHQQQNQQQQQQHATAPTTAVASTSLWGRLLVWFTCGCGNGNGSSTAVTSTDGPHHTSTTIEDPHHHPPHHTAYYYQQQQQHQYWWQRALRMGTAPPRIALFYIIVLVLTKTFAQGLSNLSMSQMNYPAKVLFKSANPIVTIVIGVVWMKKHYPMRDYFVVLLLILGLYIFITDNTATLTKYIPHGGRGGGSGIRMHLNAPSTSTSSSSTARGAVHAAVAAAPAAATTSLPESTPLGIVYVVLSMIGSAGVPMIQEYCITTYHASVEDLIYWSFVGSAFMSLALAIVTGEFVQGLSFVYHSHANVYYTWWIFFAFCTFGFCGANFSTAITAQYGALVNGIANTVRKAVTIGLSFVMFPERNVLTGQKMMGTAVFFLGLLIKILSKDTSSYGHGHSHSQPQQSGGGVGSGKEKELGGGGLWETMKRSLSMPTFPPTSTSAGTTSGHYHNSHEDTTVGDVGGGERGGGGGGPGAGPYPTSLDGWWQGVRDGFASLRRHPPQQQQLYHHLHHQHPSGDIEQPYGSGSGTGSGRSGGPPPPPTSPMHIQTHVPSGHLLHASVSMPSLT